MKLRKYKRCLVIFLSIIVLLGGMELFSYSAMAVLSRFGIFDDTFEAAQLGDRTKMLPSPEPRTKYHPYLLYQVEGNSSFWDCTTDKYGFLHNGNPDSFQPYDKPERVYRIFFLGGSTAASYHAHANELTIPAFLERFLKEDERLKRQYKASRFEVINAGRSGYFSTQELFFMLLDLIYYEPDMIITFDGYNEWIMSIEQEWKPHTHIFSKRLTAWFNQTQSIPGLMCQIALRVKLYISSFCGHTFHYTKTMLGGIVYRAKKLIASKGKTEYRKYQVDDSTPVNEESIDIYKQNLISFIGICNARDIRYIALLQPTFGLFKDRLSKKEEKIVREHGYALKHKRAYFAKLRNLFKNLQQQYASEGIIIEDITDVFENETGDIFHGFCHYKKPGNQLIAKKIHEIIREK